MHSVTVFASLVSLAALARAQAGRFPCTAIIAGVPTANQNACTTLTATGLNQGVLPTDDKADGFTPVGSICVPDTATTFSCGFTNAPCNPQNTGAASACDNGICVVTDPAVPTVGTCAGSFGTVCNSLDASCLGYLYCTDATFATTPADTCGGIGSYCTEANLAGIADPTAQQIVYDALCGSGYCNAGTGQCATQFLLGQDCSTDPTFGCSSGLTCTTNVAAGTQTCQTTVVPSGAARARRNIHARRSHLCPASQTACSISNSGFECIDTQTSIEACGGCPDEGGVDCTLLPGFGSVACVAGRCEQY